MAGIKSIFKLIVIIFLCALQVYAIAEPKKTRKVLIDRIIAIVNDDVITQTDLQRSLFPLVRQLKNVYQGGELQQKMHEASIQVLEELISNKLILQTAKHLKEKEILQVQDREVNQYMQKIISQFPSKEVFEETLKQENLSFEDFKQDTIDQLLVKSLVSREVSSKVLITKQQVQDYYHEHTNDFSFPPQITFRQIWLKSGSKMDEKKTQINDLRLQVLNGIDFGELAKQYSEGPKAKEGGLWENIEQGKFIPELEDIIWNTKPGEVTDVVETHLGFHLIKVEVIQKSRTLEMNEVWNKIENQLYIKQAEEIRHKWLSDLKSKAHIVVHDLNA